MSCDDQHFKEPIEHNCGNDRHDFGQKWSLPKGAKPWPQQRQEGVEYCGVCGRLYVLSSEGAEAITLAEVDAVLWGFPEIVRARWLK